MNGSISTIKIFKELKEKHDWLFITLRNGKTGVFVNNYIYLNTEGMIGYLDKDTLKCKYDENYDVVKIEDRVGNILWTPKWIEIDKKYLLDLKKSTLIRLTKNNQVTEKILCLDNICDSCKNMSKCVKTPTLMFEELLNVDKIEIYECDYNRMYK
jgi:hypothetical protein